MYPRNAVAPERIAVGAVVLIADGTVQTATVSVTVVPQGGASAAGGGTTSYEQGIVFYLPTQAETNYTSFIVTAYKASCIPVSVTVVTTASVTPGQVRLEGVTHTGAVIPTVSAVTGLTAANLDAAVSTRATPTNITAATGIVLSGVTHTGAVIPTVTTLTNDAGITQAGADKAWGTAARVLTAGTNIALAKGTGVTGFNDLSAAGVAAATWDAATATYGVAGSYGLLVETNLDAATTSRMATYAQPAGFLAATFPAGTLANTTNITAGTIAAVTTVNGLAANTITAAAIADGAIDRATFAADTGIVSVRSGTAQAGAATTITLDAGASAVTDFYKNTLIVLTGGTGAGLSKSITAYNGTTKVATVSTWAVTPDATTTFAIIANDAVVGATAPTAVEVANEVQTRTIAAVTVVNGLAANVITAAATAADFTTEIQAGLATPTNITAASGIVLSGVTHTGAVIPTVSAVTGLTAANLDAAVSTRATPTNITAATGIVLSGVTHTGAVIPTVTTLTGHTAQTGDAFARIGAPAGASVSADVAAVKAQTATIQTDTDDIQTRIPAALVGGRIDANVGAIASDTDAVTRLERVLSGNTTGTVGAASTTTSIVTSAMSPSAAAVDQFKGKILSFDAATTTVNLRGQSTDITGSSAAGILTVTALTTVPVSGDIFVVS